jgi:hypothetical protein
MPTWNPSLQVNLAELLKPLVGVWKYVCLWSTLYITYRVTILNELQILTI